MSLDLFEREVLERVKGGTVTIDYGAGVGYFTIPLLRYFRKVYVVEANPDIASKLNGKLESNSIENVKSIVSTNPCDLDIEGDFILFANILHEVESYENFIG